MTNRICNACAARARQPPDNLADLLTWLAPPLAVLNFLRRSIRAARHERRGRRLACEMGCDQRPGSRASSGRTGGLAMRQFGG